MKKILKSRVCGTREQWIVHCSQKIGSMVAAEKKKKKKGKTHEIENAVVDNLYPNAL